MVPLFDFFRGCWFGVWARSLGRKGFRAGACVGWQHDETQIHILFYEVIQLYMNSRYPIFRRGTHRLSDSELMNA